MATTTSPRPRRNDDGSKIIRRAPRAATAKQKADRAAEAEATAAANQAAVDALPENLRTMPYRELADLAKPECEAAKKAKKAKKAKPSTPHLDAMNARYANGESYSAAGTPKAEKVKPEAPVLTGHKPIALRSEKHAGLVDVVLKGLDSHTNGLWLMVKRGEEQTVADRLAAKGAEVAKVIYDARLYAATYTMVRLGFPKVTGSRRGSADKLIDALNAAKATWSVTIKLDGTLTYRVTDADGGTIVEGGARQVAAAEPLWLPVNTDA